MLVKDEALQGRHAHMGAKLDYADRVNEATVAELGRARLMADGDLAPNNPLRQLGRILTPRDFEERIVAKLGVPNLICETHPTNAGKRCMFQVREGAKVLICVYENNPMPEFSIVMGVEKWIPDEKFVGEGGRVVQRGDLESSAPPVTNAEAAVLIDKHGLAGALGELKKRADDVEPSRLGMRKIVTPGAEKVRGWRTVLIYMMQHGLVSPEQIRAVVGNADRASWAGYTNGDKAALAAWLN